MTYVINFGVPPLLFAQVLYGRAIYTSSVLIGVWWMAVIPLLMFCYWLLYRFIAAIEGGRAAWWIGALAWLIAGSIAKIYATNMTLMLRPEVWRAMYVASPGGAILPPFDPTLTWRWLFMLTGGLTFAGLWMAWLAGSRRIDSALRDFLLSRGGVLAAAATIAQLVAAHFVFHNQPEGVRDGGGRQHSLPRRRFCLVRRGGVDPRFLRLDRLRTAEPPLGRLARRRLPASPPLQA